MTDSLPNPRSRRFLVATVILLFLLRLTTAFLLPRVVKWDEPDYLLLGQNLWAGRGYTSGWVPEVHYTPLYPAVTGLLDLTLHNPERASDLAFAIFSALLLLPVWVLAQRTYGRRTAWLAALLIALFPPFAISVLYWGTLTEPLYLALIYAGLALLLVAHERQSWRRMAGVGMAAGMAYLTRPEAVSFFAAGLLWWLIASHFHRPQNRQLAITGSAAYVIAFLLCAAPYIVYLHDQTGRWTVSGKLAVTWDIGQAVQDRDPAEYDRVTAGLDPEGNEIIWFSPHRFDRNLVQIVAADPGAVARRLAQNTRILVGRFTGRTAFPWPLVPPVALGLFTVAWSRRRLRREALLALGLLPIVTFLPFHVELRFFAPAFVVLLIWSAEGLTRFGDWLVATAEALWPPLAAGKRAPALGLLPVGLAIIYLLAAMPATFRVGVQSTDFGHKDAGLWLRENTPPDAVILTRDIAVALYAERAWVPSPHAEFDSYLGYARRHGADYLVTDERELTVLRPHLRFLLETDNPPPGLTAVYDRAGNKGRVIVYHLDARVTGE